MFDLTVKNVDLFGDTVVAAQDKEGQIWAGVKWLCDGLGLSEGQGKSERKKLQEDIVLSEGTKFHPLGRGNANKDVLCLRHDFVPLWIAKITITPAMKENNPELVDKLVRYQLKAKDVLAEAFLPKKKQRRAAQAESLASVNNAVKILTPLLEKAGCDSKIQLLTAKSLYEKAEVFIPIQIEADKRYWDTVHIASRVGIYVRSSGKPADRAVNEIIRRIGVTEDDYTETWESKGSWQGTVRKYSDSVIERVACWIADNDYPADIEYQQTDGQVKAYHVSYKSREVA